MSTQTQNQTPVGIDYKCLWGKQSSTPMPSQSDLRQEADLLRRFERDVAIAGLVGEKHNAKVVLLAAASALLEKPLSVSVAGESAAGKNALTGAVAKFIPDEGKKIITGMSEKVLMHAAVDEYQHKAVFIAEYEGVSGADYAIRTMQSERVIEWEFVDSSSNGLKKKTCRINGPVAFIQATTRTTLHPENETRLLFLQMDESEAQTSAIIDRQAREASQGASRVPQALYESWHELFRTLMCTDVRIPFAEQLASHFPKGRVSSRRDFPKLLGLIEVSAFIHQHQRPIIKGNIIAGPQDYLNAKKLFEHCYYAGPHKSVGDFLKALGKLKGSDFSVAEMIEATRWRKSKTYQVLGRAEELGGGTGGSAIV